MEKVRATIPRAVKPEGRGAGGAGSPVRSSQSTRLPAALPTTDRPAASQALR